MLKVFSEMYPEAPIYTLLYDKKHTDHFLAGKKIEPSIIQKMPGGVNHYQWYMPFMPMAVEFFDLRQFDLVLSSSSAFSKGVITSPDTLHISYCHSPTRYLWDYTHQYINELRYNKFIKKIISLVLNYVRIWDKVAADRVDLYIANSMTVKQRIRKYYRRDSTIIYPPVEIEKFTISKDIGDYYLIGCRLAPYKRVDIVIEAFVKSGKKLKIFGDGVDMKRLQKISEGRKNIEFLGRINDTEKAELFSKCKAFLHPQDEDFGITPVEAMAAGRPVIAYKKGGATETVKENLTGVFFDEQSSDAIIKAVEDFESRPFDPQVIRQTAEKYSTERFKKEIRDFLDTEYRRHKDNLTRN